MKYLKEMVFACATICCSANADVPSFSKNDSTCDNLLPIPKIYSSTYDIARKSLIKAGWKPNSKPLSHGNTEDVRSGNGPIFWGRKYYELDFCSGTGYAFCRFEFIDPNSNILAVITAGEEANDSSYQAIVDRVFIESTKAGKQQNEYQTCKKQYFIPELSNTTYDIAHDLLIKEGWIPNSRHWSYVDSENIQSGNGPIFWEKGYDELESCSDTKEKLCKFEFKDPYSNTLVVVTSGEETPDNSRQAKVDHLFIK